MTVPAALKSLHRHDLYYIPSADLTFVVEGVQFRVHRYFFERESDFFRVQLSSAVTSPDGQVPGSNDSNGIILDEVTASDFARFLWVFYNPHFSLYDEASLEDWGTILRLSHRWFFPEVKNLAIRELQRQTMEPVKRIALYHEFDVDRNLLIPDYAALCEREQPLTLDEGLDLGMETTLMIAWGRELARSNRLQDGPLGALPTLRWEDILAMVRDVFKIPPHPVEGMLIDEDTTTPSPTHAKDDAPPLPAKDAVNGSNTANRDDDDEAQPNGTSTRSSQEDQENDTGGQPAEQQQENKGRKNKGNKGKKGNK